jgi:hypothetical protein
LVVLSFQVCWPQLGGHPHPPRLPHPTHQLIQSALPPTSGPSLLLLMPPTCRPLTTVQVLSPQQPKPVLPQLPGGTVSTESAPPSATHRPPWLPPPSGSKPKSSLQPTGPCTTCLSPPCLLPPSPSLPLLLGAPPSPRLILPQGLCTGCASAWNAVPQDLPTALSPSPGSPSHTCHSPLCVTPPLCMDFSYFTYFYLHCHSVSPTRRTFCLSVLCASCE